MKMDSKTLARESGIELLKIIAIYLIIISHMVQSLSLWNNFMPIQDYIINLSGSTTNIQYFILVIMRCFGTFGNNLFFICSAWFLLKSDTWNKKKWLFMLLEVWFISVAILFISSLILDGPIDQKTIIQSFFPTIFGNNWYISCYLIFYPIHPILNKIIYGVDKKTLLRIAFVGAVVYCGLNLLLDCFYSSNLVLWVTIYFIIAYIQLYMKDFCDNTKANVILLCVGLAVYILLEAATNIMGFYLPFMYNQMLRWNNNCHPCVIAVVIALLNLFRKFRFKSKTVNYVASLSLLIYLIHENTIVRQYFRPLIWIDIFLKQGYDHVVLWVLLTSLLIFIASLIIATIYDMTFRKLIRKLSNALYPVCCNIYRSVEALLLKLH